MEGPYTWQATDSLGLHMWLGAPYVEALSYSWRYCVGSLQQSCRTATVPHKVLYSYAVLHGTVLYYYTVGRGFGSPPGAGGTKATSVPHGSGLHHFLVLRRISLHFIVLIVNYKLILNSVVAGPARGLSLRMNIKPYRKRLPWTCPETVQQTKRLLGWL